jgi:hypothetical protein
MGVDDEASEVLANALAHDASLAVMTQPSAMEDFVLAKEEDYLVVTGASVSGEDFDIGTGERAKPAPGSSEGMGQAGDRTLKRGIAGKQSTGESVYERRVQKRVGQGVLQRV